MSLRIPSLPCAAAAIVLGLSASLPALAETTNQPALAPGRYSYDTYFTPRDIGAGSYEGVLQLQVSGDGTISGYFRNIDSGDFHDVTGGESGKNIWLDLGTGTHLINATFENGKIVGGVYATAQPYDFVADPQPNPHL